MEVTVLCVSTLWCPVGVRQAVCLVCDWSAVGQDNSVQNKGKCGKEEKMRKIFMLKI